jgi:hypothetical protein
LDRGRSCSGCGCCRTEVKEGAASFASPSNGGKYRCQNCICAEKLLVDNFTNPSPRNTLTWQYLAQCFRRIHSPNAQPKQSRKVYIQVRVLLRSTCHAIGPTAERHALRCIWEYAIWKRPAVSIKGPVSGICFPSCQINRMQEQKTQHTSMPQLYWWVVLRPVRPAVGATEIRCVFNDATAVGNLPNQLILLA